MRRRALTSLFVLLTTAVLTAGLGGSASAATAAPSCAAFTEPPHLRVGGTRMYSTGQFDCLDEVLGMTVTVCIEEQYSATAAWYSRGCTTVKDLYEWRDSIEATHSISIPVYATFLRATVTGTNARGDRATFTSPPLWWFNCACYLG